MTSPLIPDNYKNVRNEKVTVGRHTIIGTGSSILPGVELSEGCAIGAMSLVTKSTMPWHIYAGIPVKILRERSQELLEIENEFKKYEKGK